MKWCCAGLEFAFNERHKRGLFVFCEPTHLEAGPTYWLGMRSVNIADKARLAEQLCKVPSSDRPVPITLVTWHRVKYCPWCGSQVERFYRKTYRALADPMLSEEHQIEAEPPAALDARKERAPVS